jgi:hypothetical protein
LPLVAFVPIVKNAGARGSTFTVTAALVRPLFVVWICAVPVDRVAGTRKVTCVLLTKLTGTAVPLMVTPTPLTESVSHWFDQCDSKRFDRPGSKILSKWLDDSSKGRM